MIDLPSVSNISDNDWKLDVGQLVKLMNDLASLKGAQVIFRQDIKQSHVFYEELWLLDYALSTRDTKSYSLADLNKAKHTISSPTLTKSAFPSDLNDEITVQVDTLHNSVNTLFLISSVRRDNSTDKLRTERDHKEKEHKTLTYDAGSALSDFIESTKPVLDQLKHVATGYYKGGKYVSPFSSYDPRNEQPAIDLLARAYNDYCGNDIDPKYLYTWDSKHNTYVQFRRSAEGTYHGMDYSNMSNVPDYIKAIYHHY